MSRVLAILLVFALVCSSAAAEPKVAVEKKAVKVTRKAFDPKKPPGELPELKAGEEAAAVSWYGVEVYIHVEVLNRERRKDETVVTTNRVKSLKVTTTLEVTIWLPEKASGALKEHEEGHRRIAEMYYEDAEKVARRLGEGYVGRSFAGQGKDVDASINAAIDKATKELIDAYTGEINGPAQRAQEIFDEITDHGRKRNVSVDDGIRQAVERQRKEGSGKGEK